MEAATLVPYGKVLGESEGAESVPLRNSYWNIEFGNYIKENRKHIYYLPSHVDGL